MRKNHMNLKTVRLDFQEDEGVLTYEKDSGTYQLRFGLNHNVEQEFPEIYSGPENPHACGKGIPHLCVRCMDHAGYPDAADPGGGRASGSGPAGGVL